MLNAGTPLESVASAVDGLKEITIDCGVMDMAGKKLNAMMKIARGAGVEHFILVNVCGQDLIGTGIAGPARISVYGLMGNHSCAFVDGLTINTFPTRFSNSVWCPGDAQVAIGTSANPVEMNIGGSVDDLFASYAPSGNFRVAGQGGNRCVLRAGAGIPQIWREIDYNAIRDMGDNERVEAMLFKYQKRHAEIELRGWDSFIEGFSKELERRSPPVVVFGRKVKDYFMEYAQGTIGIILNVYNLPSPIGYYVCSGMTAGKAYIRGEVKESQLGNRVKVADMNEEDIKLISRETRAFYASFKGVIDSRKYNEKLEMLIKACDEDEERYASGFVKIVPV